ncbi:hypothetical protein GDI3135 [Gluconacetobacter diazotrophicus PA1 5]|uniref:Uncharacterized protein n=1 Tax=Gluconacetobacter diazotrophicus (strain ATCC 49037 / DSM 5601 / CCUG 37298 / CIP 103539 / LMG 7603 / PAl5) TaxID=272568 RepID=A9HSH1_GLUDA|nr:hypothetical protein GDI3135 [Gluconacetobacter diazotrophicus PA1 5]
MRPEMGCVFLDAIVFPAMFRPVSWDLHPIATASELILKHVYRHGE